MSLDAPGSLVQRQAHSNEASGEVLHGAGCWRDCGPWPEQMPGWPRRGGRPGCPGLRGERNPSAKLTLPAVQWLRRRRLAGLTYGTLAELARARWGVRISERSVCAACRGETWSDEG